MHLLPHRALSHDHRHCRQTSAVSSFTAAQQLHSRSTARALPARRLRRRGGLPPLFRERDRVVAHPAAHGLLSSGRKPPRTSQQPAETTSPRRRQCGNLARCRGCVRLRPSASGRRIALRHCRETSRSIDRFVCTLTTSCARA
jgi:hypothetical protein